MSSIVKIKTSDGGRWKLRYRAPDGASRSKTFKLRRDAEAFETKVRHDVATGIFVDPSAGRITFNTYSTMWLDRRRGRLKPATIATFESQLRKHLVPEFGSTPLRAISREAVKSWASSLTTVQQTTARSLVFTLAAILREAVDDGRISRNPAERVKVGAKTERRVDPMHIAQIAPKVPALAEAMPARWRAAVLLMASTGLRLGECLGLTADRVNFLRRTIRVDRQLVTVNATTTFGTPKTRAAVRTIPVPKTVIELLAAHLAQFPAGDHDLIFTTATTRQNRAGLPVARSRWSEAYRAACATVGVDGRTRTHDLRHVAASSMIAGGLSVAAVQAVLGHASPAETLDVYTHLWPSDEDRTRDAIEAASSGWLATSG